jgi:hypothetical protein
MNMAYRCTGARKNIAKPVTTCTNHSVVSPWRRRPPWRAAMRYWRQSAGNLRSASRACSANSEAIAATKADTSQACGRGRKK